LSGGEKARVALAKTLIYEANFLLLDEPTNHLDIQSMNILIQALQDYEGSFITVSHDRHFISQIANKIWWIENGEIKEYLGTYDEWKFYMQERELAMKQESANAKKNETSYTAVTKTAEKNPNSESDKQKKQIQQQLDQIEKELETLNLKKSDIELKLSETNDPKVIGTLSEEYKILKSQIDEKNTSFETIFEQLLSY
jgi:ATP-binding cassette subfamily F protein 3